MVQGDDFTIRGGAADAAIWQKAIHAERLAHDLRLPLVRLVDGTGGGGSVKTLEQMGFSYVPPLPGFELVVRNLAIVPVVAGALGPVAGLGAARVVCSHFSVIARGTAQLFVAGPPVVAAAMGEAPDKEQLGGARIQARAGGVDNVADDEEDALAQLKRFLSYLPPTSGRRRRSSPRPTLPTGASRGCSIVPRDRRRPYKMRAILAAVLDRDSRFELGAAFGRPLITCLARLGGRPVGVLASDPEHYGGGLTATPSEKLARFVDICDQFHLPGGEPRRRAGLRHRHGRGAGRRFAAAAGRSPSTRRACPGSRSSCAGLRRGRRRSRRRLAAQLALRLALGGLGVAADRGRLGGGLSPRAGGRRGPGRAAGRVAARLDAVRSPFRSAEHFSVEEIIDPRDTRPLLCDWAERAHELIRHDLAAGRRGADRGLEASRRARARPSRPRKRPRRATGLDVCSMCREKAGWE